MQHAYLTTLLQDFKKAYSVFCLDDILPRINELLRAHAQSKRHYRVDEITLTITHCKYLRAVVYEISTLDDVTLKLVEYWQD